MNSSLQARWGRLTLGALIAAQMLFLAGCQLNGKYVEEVNLTVDASDASKIDVKNVNGSINLKGGDASEIKIFAVKTVRATSDDEAKRFAPQVEIIAEREGDSISVYAKYPKVRWGKSVNVEFTIDAPAGLETAAENVNGAIDIKNMRNGVHANVVNGRLKMTDVAGEATGETVNGRVDVLSSNLTGSGSFQTVNGEVTVKALQCEGSIDVETVNGKAVIELPPTFAGEIDIQTVNGSANTDFEVDAAINKKNHVQGTINGGGSASIRMNAVNGSVQLKQVKGQEPA